MIQEPFTAKLVQLQDLDCNPCQLALVQGQRGCKFLVVHQVEEVLLKASITRARLKLHLQSASRKTIDVFKRPCEALKRHLVLLGAVNKHCAGTLVSLAVCIKALSRQTVPTLLVEHLRALHSNQGVILQQATVEALQQNVEGSVQPRTLLFAAHLPVQLPLDSVPTLEPGERLSLASPSPTLSMQLQELEDHSKQMVVIGRRGGPVCSETWRDITKQIFLYLGYLHKHHRVLSPSLEHFTRGDLLHAYFGSKGKRGDRGSSICIVISVARRVVLWWKGQCPAQSAVFAELDTWLGAWAHQAKQAWPTPRKNVAELKQQGKWQDAAELLGLLVQQKASAECLYSGQGVLLPAGARQLHDVALMCMMFGWLPPPRSSCIRTLCPPWHTGPCPHEDCRKPDCWGNRIFVSGPADSRTLRIQLPHHKTAKVWGPIEYDLPADLSVLVCLYLCKAYRVLRDDLGGQHPHMFMDKKGQAFQQTSFNLYFKSALLGMGGAAMPPHRLRHVFVVARMTRAGAEAPRDTEGAAYCMGHEAKQWDLTYDLSSLQRKGQAAIEGMAAWRREVLQSHPAAAHLLLQPSPLAVQASLAAVDNLRVGVHEELVTSSVTCTSASSEVPSESTGQASSDSDSDVDSDDLAIDLEQD